jgi:hypothetical protein
MILKKKYCEETKTQKVWYDSSMIFYSEMIEDAENNYGDLFVTFKNGSTYVYKKVQFDDYLLLIGGGTDASQGKTLNKVIKGKYEYERVSDRNIDELILEMNQDRDKIEEIQKTYFISGHRDLTENEFEYYYIPLIQEAIYETVDAKFIVGDCVGCDIMAQNYLVNIIDDISKITVYCVGNAPRNINPEIINVKNGFTDDREKDIAMTNDSFKDIAMVRDPEIWSGTGENILRRYMFK